MKDRASGRMIRSLLIVSLIGVALYFPVRVSESYSSGIDNEIEKASHYLLSQKSLDDWGVIAVSRAEKDVPTTYLNQKASDIKKMRGVFPQVIDLEKSVIGIVAGGGDPCNVEGYNLVSQILGSKQITSQHLEGIILGLIAVDSKNYATKGSLWSREKLIQALLLHQNKDGGWPLFEGGESEVETTSMVMTALAPYKERKHIQNAGDHAMAWLSKKQAPEGGFILRDEESSESCAKVLLALTSWGVDPKSTLFTKEQGDVVTRLLSFQTEEGGFPRFRTEEPNPTSTSLALIGLISYDYFIKDNGFFFRFEFEETNVERMKAKQIMKIPGIRLRKNKCFKKSNKNKKVAERNRDIETSLKNYDAPSHMPALKKDHPKVLHKTSLKEQKGTWLPIGIGVTLIVIVLGSIWGRRIWYS